MKNILVLILNIVPFFLACFLYEGGVKAMLIFPFLQVLINLVNYKLTKKIVSFIALNSAMMISTICSIWIITKLYYNNISSDVLTLAVGNFAVLVGIVFIVVITLISVVCRKVRKKFKQ